MAVPATLDHADASTEGGIRDRALLGRKTRSHGSEARLGQYHDDHKWMTIAPRQPHSLQKCCKQCQCSSRKDQATFDIWGPALDISGQSRK
jgi:hypothetical protein